MAECFLSIVGITKIYSEKQKTATIQEMFGSIRYYLDEEGVCWLYVQKNK